MRLTAQPQRRLEGWSAPPIPELVLNAATIFWLRERPEKVLLPEVLGDGFDHGALQRVAGRGAARQQSPRRGALLKEPTYGQPMTVGVPLRQPFLQRMIQEAGAEQALPQKNGQAPADPGRHNSRGVPDGEP